MFWGLVMEPNKRYSQTVEKSFHVSMAALDVTNAGDDVVQVTVCYDDTNYLLCTLTKGLAWQIPLDLNFQEGTEIAFTCNGLNRVHLTGYLIPEDDDDLMDELEEEEEEDEEQIPELVEKQSKRKAVDPPKENRKRKRIKQEAEFSEDEDIDLDGTNANVEDSDDDEEEEGDESPLNEENEVKEDEDEDDDDEDDEDDEDDDDDDDDDEEDEEEEKAQKKPNKQQQHQQLQRGKKSKQVQQQQEQQKKKKQDKQQLVNGKDVKQEQQINKQQKKRVVEGGVQIKDVKIGSGAPAKTGKFVSVYYVGRLQNGKKFDATTQGDGFKFRLGKGEVIKGWDVGIAGMKVGGKRQITIPPSMAYGAKGSPPAIPGNSTLVFEVELKNVH